MIPNTTRLARQKINYNNNKDDIRQVQANNSCAHVQARFLSLTLEHTHTQTHLHKHIIHAHTHTPACIYNNKGQCQHKVKDKKQRDTHHLSYLSLG